MSKEYFEGASVDEEQRQDRARYWFNLLKIVACVACALYLLKIAIPNAQAQEAPLTLSAKDAAGNIVRLTLEPCEGAPAWLGLRKAEMRYEGVDYVACWREVGGGSARIR